MLIVVEYVCEYLRCKLKDAEMRISYLSKNASLSRHRKKQKQELFNSEALSLVTVDQDWLTRSLCKVDEGKS